MSLRRLISCMLFFGLFSSMASARSFYFETGFGLTELMNGSNLFPGAPASTPFGFSSNLALYYCFYGNDISSSFGIEAHSNFGTYELLAPYAAYRFQANLFYLGFGAAPVVLTNSNGSLATQSGTLSGLIEFGTLWPVTPKFSLALQGDAQFVKSSAGIGPSPAAEAALQMRFYFGFIAEPKAQSIEWTGWRYPFGNEIQK